MTESTIETTGLIEPWLYATLSGDATLSALVGGRFVGTVASLGDFAVPAVLFTMSSTRDVRAVDGTIIDTSSIYIVKGITPGSSWSLGDDIASRINHLINRSNVTLSPSGSLTCVRDRILEYPEELSGQQYRHLGGFYRIRCSAS